MEQFLEGVAILRLWHVISDEKICTCYSSHLGKCNDVLTEQFLQGNVPLSCLVNAKPPFMSWQISAFNEVNEWAPNIYNNNSKSKSFPRRKLLSQYQFFFSIKIILNLQKTEHKQQQYYNFILKRIWFSLTIPVIPAVVVSDQLPLVV